MSRFQFMNPANAYWAPPQYTVTQEMSRSGHIGFFMNLPYPDPITQPWSYGEGNENIYGKRELVFTTLPEMYAVGNVLPMTSGIPRVDPRSFQAQHSREHYTLKV